MAAKSENKYGNFIISNNVIAGAAGIIATSCYGVVGMASRSTKDGIVSLLKPSNFSKGIKVTKQGSPYFSDEFVRIEGDIFEQRGHKIDDVCPNDLTRDTVATEAGYTTITPLLTTRTNLEVFEKFKNLFYVVILFGIETKI